MVVRQIIISDGNPSVNAGQYTAETIETRRPTSSGWVVTVPVGQRERVQIFYQYGSASEMNLSGSYETISTLPKEPVKGIVEGTVHYSNGEPIINTIMVLNTGAITTYTGANGSFCFSDIDLKNYELSISLNDEMVKIADVRAAVTGRDSTKIIDLKASGNLHLAITWENNHVTADCRDCSRGHNRTRSNGLAYTDTQHTGT